MARGLDFLNSSVRPGLGAGTASIASQDNDCVWEKDQRARLCCFVWIFPSLLAMEPSEGQSVHVTAQRGCFAMALCLHEYLADTRYCCWGNSAWCLGRSALGCCWVLLVLLMVCLCVQVSAVCSACLCGHYSAAGIKWTGLLCLLILPCC